MKTQDGQSTVKGNKNERTDTNKISDVMRLEGEAGATEKCQGWADEQEYCVTVTTAGDRVTSLTKRMTNRCQNALRVGLYLHQPFFPVTYPRLFSLFFSLICRI